MIQEIDEFVNCLEAAPTNDQTAGACLCYCSCSCGAWEQIEEAYGSMSKQGWYVSS